MFFFYVVWSLSFFLLNFIHTFIENNFLVKNNPFLIRKRTFKYLSYFEKIVLVLFYKKGWFENSLANLYRKKDIIEHRRNYYPTIYFFHNYINKFEFNYENLKLLVKDYNYYKKNNKYFKIFKILEICFNKKNSFFIKYLILLNLFNKKYYSMNSHFFFKNVSSINLVKLNKTFNLFLLRSEKKLKYFDLNKWNDWYFYNFNDKIIYRYNSLKKLNKKQKKQFNDFKMKNIFKWSNILFKYKIKLIKTDNFLKKNFKGIIFFKINLNNFFKIKINSDFRLLLNYYKIKFSESSITKYINTSNLKINSLFYIRKNRIFNKGRYSRNRQLYRTGVYWCLWLNIIMVYGLYFIFYRFTFNFGYFWWGIMFLAFSTILSRISKYNFYNLYFLKNEFMLLIKWYGFLFNNLIYFFEKWLKNYFLILNIYNYVSIYKNKINFIFENYNFYFLKFYKNFYNNKKRIKMVYIWQGMKEYDNSFLKYKTIIHWIKELYRLIIT